MLLSIGTEVNSGADINSDNAATITGDARNIPHL
jgi:hypothetical protein